FNGLNGIEQVLNSRPWIGHVVTFVGAMIGAGYSAKRFATRQRDTAYNDLDNLYQKILEQRVDKPWLKEFELASEAPDYRSNLAEAARRAHAYMVWTLLESIRDRLEPPRDKKSQRIWQPVLVSEGTRYINELKELWLYDCAFQDDFIHFLRKGGFTGIYRS